MERYFNRSIGTILNFESKAIENHKNSVANPVDSCNCKTKNLHCLSTYKDSLIALPKNQTVFQLF